MHKHYCPIFPLEAEGNAHDGRFSKVCFYSNNQRRDVVKFLSQYLEGNKDLDRVTKTEELLLQKPIPSLIHESVVPSLMQSRSVIWQSSWTHSYCRKGRRRL